MERSDAIDILHKYLAPDLAEKVIQTLRTADTAEIEEMRRELKHLRQWKQDWTPVINGWSASHD